jgi:hypothetical protein
MKAARFVPLNGRSVMDIIEEDHAVCVHVAPVGMKINLEF